MPDQARLLTLEDVSALAAAVRRRLRTEVFQQVAIDVLAPADCPGELEIRVAAKGVFGVLLALAEAGYPSRPRPGRQVCECCSVARFVGPDLVVGCRECGHFFEMHHVERQQRLLPPLGPDRVGIIVSAPHDLIPAVAGRRCSRCALSSTVVPLTQRCEQDAGV